MKTLDDYKKVGYKAKETNLEIVTYEKKWGKFTYSIYYDTITCIILAHLKRCPFGKVIFLKK